MASSSPGGKGDPRSASSWDGRLDGLKGKYGDVVVKAVNGKMETLVGVEGAIEE